MSTDTSTLAPAPTRNDRRTIKSRSSRGNTARRARQGGAALLIAMLILSLVSTLAAGMVWQQWRAVQVETAERARAQAAWILVGALDWARLILREDSRSKGADHLGEPWAVPLAEARLSTFLAADREQASDDGPEAFLSGSITDATARYNLRNLVVDGDTPIPPAQLQILQNLCASAGLSSDTAQRIATGLRDAWAGEGENAAVAPESVSQLTWLGLEPAAIEKLRPWVEILPVGNTKVNVNTAPREVLAAVLGGDLSTAARLVEVRQGKPFTDMGEVTQIAPDKPDDPAKASERLDVRTDYFEVHGRLRLEDRVLEERSLVRRNNLQIVLLQRERLSRSSAQMP